MKLIRLVINNLKLISFCLLITITLLSARALGQVQDNGATYLNLSVTESVKLEQDLLVATLVMNFEGSDTKTVQTKLNQAMSEAAKIFKNNAEIEFTTANYYTYKNTNPEDKKVKTTYTASQTIELKSLNSQKLLEVVANLQNSGMLVQNLNYATSNSKIEEINDSLMTKAISKLLSKANLVAKSLNKEQVNVIEINISGNNNYPYRPVARMGLMSTKVASESEVSPVIEPGKTEVSLTVHAKIAM